MELNLNQKKVERRFKRLRKQTDRRLNALEKQAKSSIKQVRRVLPGYQPTFTERVAGAAGDLYSSFSDRLAERRSARDLASHTLDDARHTVGHVADLAQTGAASGLARAQQGARRVQETAQLGVEKAQSGVEKAQDVIQPRVQQVQESLAQGIEQVQESSVRGLEKRAPKVAKRLGLESKQKKRQKLAMRMLPLVLLLGVGVFLLMRRRAHSRALAPYRDFPRDDLNTASRTYRSGDRVVARVGEMDAEAAETAASLGSRTAALEGPPAPPVDPGFQTKIVPVTSGAAAIAAAPSPIASMAGAYAESSTPAVGRGIEGPADVLIDETVSTVDPTTATYEDGERSGANMSSILAIIMIVALVAIIIWIAFRAWSGIPVGAVPAPAALAAYWGFVPL